MPVAPSDPAPAAPVPAAPAPAAAPAPPDAPAPEDDDPASRGSVSEAWSGLPKRTIDSLIVAPGACARRICCQSRGARTGRLAAVVITSPAAMCAAPLTQRRAEPRAAAAHPRRRATRSRPRPAPAAATHTGHRRRRDLADDDAFGCAGRLGDRGRHRLDFDPRLDGDDAFTIREPRRARHQRVGGHDEHPAGIGERHADEAAGQREEQRAGLRHGGAAQCEHGLIPSRVRLGRIPAHELRPDRRPIGGRFEDRDVAGRIERRGRRLHGNFRRAVAGHAHDRQAALLVARDDAVGGERRAGDRLDASRRRERHEREIVADAAARMATARRLCGQHDRALELTQQVAQHGRQLVERRDARQAGQRLRRDRSVSGRSGKRNRASRSSAATDTASVRSSRRVSRVECRGGERFGHPGQSVPRERQPRHTPVPAHLARASWGRGGAACDIMRSSARPLGRGRRAFPCSQL